MPIRRTVIIALLFGQITPLINDLWAPGIWRILCGKTRICNLYRDYGREVVNGQFVLV